jgi:hypothetical protein
MNINYNLKFVYKLQNITMYEIVLQISVTS